MLDDDGKGEKKGGARRQGRGTRLGSYSVFFFCSSWDGGIVHTHSSILIEIISGLGVLGKGGAFRELTRPW